MTDLNYPLDDEAMDRDPRTAPVGILTGGTFVLDTSRVFCWFESSNSLADYLAKFVPIFYDFDEEYTAEYQEKVGPLLTRLREQGFSEELLAALNDAVKDDYVIDWWGEFDELVQNETEFARNISDGFLEEDELGRPIQDEEMDDFIDYLKTCAV